MTLMQNTLQVSLKMHIDNNQFEKKTYYNTAYTFVHNKKLLITANKQK